MVPDVLLQSPERLQKWLENAYIVLMHFVAFVLSALSGASFGGMAVAALFVFIARTLHRDELARRIAQSVAKATWALRIGGGQSDRGNVRAN